MCFTKDKMTVNGRKLDTKKPIIARLSLLKYRYNFLLGHSKVAAFCQLWFEEVFKMITLHLPNKQGTMSKQEDH